MKVNGFIKPIESLEKHPLKDGVSFKAFSTSTTKNKCRLEIVETPQQYKTLLNLRKRIYVEKERFPYKNMFNGLERESVHILAKVHDRYVGMISVKLNDQHGLPIEKYVSLKPFGDKKIAEMGKLGVLEDTDEGSVFYQLVGAAYALVRFCGYNTIVMHTLDRMRRNVTVYRRMGFQVIQKFHLFEKEMGVAMLLDLDKLNGLMWKPSQLTKLAKRLIGAINSDGESE